MRLSNLFFERSRGEKVIIGEGRDQVVIEVQRIRENNVTLTFKAGRHVKIDRMERRLENQ